MIETNETDFIKDVLEHNGLTLVFFCGENCRSCRMEYPILEGLNARIVKVNINDCPGIAEHYCITSLPSFLFVRNGDVVETLSGAQNKAKLESILQELNLVE